MRDRFGERESAMSFELPTAEEPAVVLQPAAAGDRHSRLHRRQAAPQGDGRDEQFPWRCRWIGGVDRSVDERMVFCCPKPVPEAWLDAANKQVRVVSWGRIQREDGAGPRVEDHDRAPPSDRKRPGHVALEFQVERGADRLPSLGLQRRGNAAIPHWPSQRVNLDEAHAVLTAETIVVLAFQSVTTDLHAQPRAGKTLRGEFFLRDLRDVPQDVGYAFAVRIAAFGFGLNDQSGDRDPSFLEGRNRLERHISANSHRIIRITPVAAQDDRMIDRIDGHQRADAPERGAEGFRRGGQKCHRVSGHVLGEHRAVAIEDEAPRRRQRECPQPVLL